MAAEINVIDLFAGPGGLGEGFAALRQGGSCFKIRMSVEKEPSAHRTLELRAFVRQFSKPPKYYYEYLQGTIAREELFNRYPDQAAAAREETLGGPRKLGDKTDDALIHRKIWQLKKEHRGHWIVVGGPPCQAYSLVGRARNRGVKGYKPETDEKNFLYVEYLKILTIVRPKVFVMENVPGILSATVNGKRIFPRIVNELRCPDRALGKRKQKNAEYRIYSMVTGQEIKDAESEGRHCRIRSEEYGVPQARHRVILLGVRRDVRRTPGTLKKADSTVALRDVIRDFPELRSGLSPKRSDSLERWSAEVVRQSKSVFRELRKLGLKTDKVASAVRKSKRLQKRGGQFVKGSRQFKGPTHLRRWYLDKNVGGYLNHRTKRHMPSDLGRYLYCTIYALQKKGRSPTSHDFPEKFAPDHESWEKGDFADRFKVQAWNRPAATITSHIAKDGHSNIHPDPGQCRSLTVREAARVQTFPDNYFFEGNRTEQFVQVGNAVPPWLAKQIAKIVEELIKD